MFENTAALTFCGSSSGAFDAKSKFWGHFQVWIHFAIHLQVQIKRTHVPHLLVMFDKYVFAFSYNLMASSYFSCFKKPVALSFTSCAWVRLSSALIFHASGSRSNSFNVTVAFGGTLKVTVFRYFTGGGLSGLSKGSLLSSELPSCSMCIIDRVNFNPQFFNSRWRLCVCWCTGRFNDFFRPIDLQIQSELAAPHCTLRLLFSCIYSPTMNL